MATYYTSGIFSPDPDRPDGCLVRDGDDLYTSTISPLTQRLTINFVGESSGTYTAVAINALGGRMALRRDTRYKYALIRSPGNTLRGALTRPDVVIFKVFDNKAQATEYASTVLRDWVAGTYRPRGPNIKELMAKVKEIHLSPTNGDHN
ncbi:MAG: hypothetical protein JWR52_2716 [Marmoricola sp.]|nr:hypothetical protein [Marmoricola sp.]